MTTAATTSKMEGDMTTAATASKMEEDSTPKIAQGVISFLLIFLLLFLLGQSALSQSQPLAAEKCYKVALNKNLRWATTGVWSPVEDALLVSDAFGSNILNISSQGTVREPNLLQKAAFNFEMPSTVRQARGETLVEDDRLDRIISLQSRREFSIEGYKLGEIELVEFYDWVPLGDGYLAFSDILLSGEQRSAFVYVEQDRYQVYQTYDVYKYKDGVRFPNEAIYPYFRDTAAYVTSLDDETGYILFLEETPRIGKVGTQSDEITILDFFPDDFREHPMLDERDLSLHGAAQATRDYEKYERSKMVVSLYSWGGNLYLLAKEGITDDNKTPWWLIELDPSDGAERSRARLPTEDAAHLTVIPGDDRWALIKKGPVEAIGEVDAPYMPTDEMVLLPAAWVANLDHSPLVAKSFRTCDFAPR